MFSAVEHCWEFQYCYPDNIHSCVCCPPLFSQFPKFSQGRESLINAQLLVCDTWRLVKIDNIILGHKDLEVLTKRGTFDLVPEAEFWVEGSCEKLFLGKTGKGLGQWDKEVKGRRPGKVVFRRESVTESNFGSLLQGGSGDILGSTSDLSSPGVRHLGCSYSHLCWHWLRAASPLKYKLLVTWLSIYIGWWGSTLIMCQDHLEGLLKCRLLSLTLLVSDSIGLGYSPRICISNKFQVMMVLVVSRFYSEKHWINQNRLQQPEGHPTKKEWVQPLGSESISEAGVLNIKRSMVMKVEHLLLGIQSWPMPKRIWISQCRVLLAPFQIQDQIPV